jgi:hypothetical protein
MAPKQRLVSNDGKRKILAPIHPNAGLTASYRKKLDAQIEKMHRSVIYWVTAQWRRNTPVLAQDVSPAGGMRDEFHGLGAQWQANFDTMAEELGRHFAKSVQARTDGAMQAAMKKAGWTVKFKMTPGVNDALQASIGANIELIKSIPAQYLTQVQGIAMRSIQLGGDLATMTDEIEAQYGVTRRRAELIARSQNALATATITKVRQTELGIRTAIWVHSGGGHHPRPSHLKAGREKTVYDVEKGWYDPDEGKFIWPGQLVHCFPGDTIVDTSNGVRKLWKTPFDGKMVNIRVGSDLLNGTFNHPILTSRGWVPLGTVDCGDQVVCMVHQRGDVVDDDKNKPVTTFGELFESLSIVHGYVRLSGRRFNFYGDVPGGDVDEVVIVNDLLPDDINAARNENVTNFGFTKSDAMLDVSGSRVRNHVGATGCSSGMDEGAAFSRSLVGGAGEACIASTSHSIVPYQDISDIAGCMARQPEDFSNGSRAHPPVVEGNDFFGLCVPIDPAFSLNANGPELFAEFVRIASDAGSSVFKFGAGLYEFRGVEDKSVRDFSGHVFTMETEPGYYSVGSAFVQAKNCRCVARSIVEGFD